MTLPHQSRTALPSSRRAFGFVSTFTLSALAMFAALTVNPMKADTIYSNDFSGTDGNGAFTDSAPSGNWSVSGGTYNLSFTDTTIMARTASLNLGDSLDAISFTMQTDFRATSLNTVSPYNSSTIGFGAFGTNSAFSGGAGNPYYLADFTFYGGSAGQLRILKIADTNTTIGTNGSAVASGHLTNFAINTGVDYTLKLDAVYDPDAMTLSLTLGLYDSLGSLIGTKASGTTTGVLTGDYFGYRNRIGQGGTGTNFAFDNFQINTAAIPEPASFAVILGGAVMLFGFNQRRRRQA